MFSPAGSPKPVTPARKRTSLLVRLPVLLMTLALVVPVIAGDLYMWVD